MGAECKKFDILLPVAVLGQGRSFTGVFALLLFLVYEWTVNLC